MKDTRSLPGYFLMGLAIVALVACLAAAGMSQIAWTIGFGVIAVAGSLWFFCGVVARRGSCASRPAHVAEFF